MANDLPYFRFTVQAWQNGKISIESLELKGMFIDVCGYYWINDCNLTLTMLKKKFFASNHLIDELINLGILKHEKRHDKIEIEFLLRQLSELNEIKKARQAAGSKGGKAKAKLQQNPGYKDNNNNKDKIKEKFNFKSSLLALCKDENLVNDWLLVRKNKKATNSETAFKIFIDEVEKSKLSINEILTICIEKSWSGFKFEWIQNSGILKTTGAIQMIQPQQHELFLGKTSS